MELEIYTIPDEKIKYKVSHQDGGWGGDQSRDDLVHDEITQRLAADESGNDKGFSGAGSGKWNRFCHRQAFHHPATRSARTNWINMELCRPSPVTLTKSGKGTNPLSIIR